MRPTDKPASLWALSDVKQLVETEVAESTFLELKEDLPSADGAAGWRTKQKLHASERDGLAKEIVAMANSYGGVLVVGVAESDDAPKRAVALAEPLPQVHDLVDRLRSSLSSTIDPPITGLEVQAILHETQTDAGYVVVSVPPSVSRPHGFGSPPKTFVRRDDRSEPASMRDIQNMFWEGRTERERVAEELAAKADGFARYSPLRDLRFQLVAVSERPVSAFRFPEAMRRGQVMKSSGQYNIWPGASAAEFPKSTHRWSPTATGVSSVDNDTSRSWSSATWEIDETGIVSVTGSNTLDPARNSEVKEVYPGWYGKTAGELLAAASIYSTWAGYSGGWVFTGRFESRQEALVVSAGERFLGGKTIDLRVPQTIRPIRIGQDPDADELAEVARRIWATFGLLRPENDASVANGVFEVSQFR